MRALTLLVALAPAAIFVLPATTSLNDPTDVVPAAGESAPGQATTTSFDAGGVKVIHRRSDVAGVVAANLYLLGGTRQVTSETAGIELLLLDASEHGTRSYPREVLRRKMSRLGGSIVVEPATDWTMIGLRTTTDRFDSTWAILAERVMFPTLPEREVELVRHRLLAALAQRRDNPDALAHYLADSIAFAGHPYGLPVSGTERSVTSLTVADLRRYHETQTVSSRMLLVVVGDVDRDHLEALVRRTLGTLPRGDYRWTLPPRLPRATPAVVMEHRRLPTNYILGYFPGPLANERDAVVMRIATTALTGRMFAEIRTRRNLTYDVHSPYLERAATAAGLYVSTVSPSEVLRLMQAAVRELKMEMLDPNGLKRMEAHYITDYFLDNETHAAQANFLARAEIYRGDWRAAERFVDELRTVTPEQVQRAARQYIRDIRFAYVGDTTQVDRRLLSGF
ncbi:MAG TPA: pitrilysin family protein [Gemmatimonadaceae bacterium]|nr:pitrilysin family protein [Gemmatimonadaceae bacterium]